MNIHFHGFYGHGFFYPFLVTYFFNKLGHRIIDCFLLAVFHCRHSLVSFQRPFKTQPESRIVGLDKVAFTS